MCGEEGGGVIGELMARFIRDPYYLHYIFKPDCELHLAPPTEYPPTRSPRKHTKRKPKTWPVEEKDRAEQSVQEPKSASHRNCISRHLLALCTCICVQLALFNGDAAYF